MNIKYYIRLVAAFLVRFKALIAVGIVIGILVFLVFRFVFPRFVTQDVERIGIAGRFSTDSLPKSVVEQVSMGLTKVNKSGEATAGLAQSWVEDEDGKIWRFSLGEHRWQDGKKVSSADIDYNFEDVGVRRPDDKTIEFELKSGFSPFPLVVSRVVFRKGLLGTGEWRVGNVEFVGNYIRSLTLKNGSNSRKVYKFYPSEDQVKLAFKLGQIDKMVELISSKPFDEWSTVEVDEIVNYSRFVGVFYNTEDEILASKSFRQALSYAIDKDSFEGPRATGPISPYSWAYNPQVKGYDYDVGRAKELLEDTADIKLVTTPPLLDIAEKVAGYWREIGVATTVQVTSVVPEEFQAFLVMYDIPADPDQYSTWHSEQFGTNISRYKNPRIDKLLEDGRLEMDMDERKKIYLDFQRFLLEDSPATFLFHPVSYTVSRR